MKWKQKVVKIQLVRSKAWIADQCTVAESFFSRMKGLIGTKKIELGQGLLLNPCNDIHMWFMTIPIDIVFIRPIQKTQNDCLTTEVRAKVVSFKKEIRPWKLLPVRDGKATQTLELPVGTIERCNLQVGDELCIS
jgi:uncharacterized membrane protein (UPF0127 family)